MIKVVIAIIDKYLVYIRWGVLVLSWLAIAWSVHHIDELSVKAAQTDHVENVAQSIPKVITVTQTITKVVHDAKDKCSVTAMPDALRKQLQ